MTGTYQISKKALADLESIWLYTYQNWSQEQADRYYALILDEIEYISNYPLHGRDIGHVRKGYRASKVKSHFVFYRVQSKGVEVIRVLHERMDIETRLKE